MKKKSASQLPPARRSPWPVRSFMRRRLGEGGFFKLRVLVALLLCFAAITLVLFAFGKASAQPRPPAQNPQPVIRALYRGVLPVVKFDIAALAYYEAGACRGVHPARERRPRYRAAPGRATWSGCA